VTTTATLPGNVEILFTTDEDADTIAGNIATAVAGTMLNIASGEIGNLIILKSQQSTIPDSQAITTNVPISTGFPVSVYLARQVAIAQPT
jgi:hypothetical protein